MAAERLQKVIARTGLASRRHAEELIRAGRVTVDGRVVAELGVQVTPEIQRIEVDGRPLPAPARPLTIVLHKPVDVVSTARDPQGRPTVVEIASQAAKLPPGVRLYPIGRLDAESEGLILLTNDGELALQLTHPRYEHEKEYFVLVAERPSAEQLVRLRRGGIEVEGRAVGPAAADVRARRRLPPAVQSAEAERERARETGTWLRIVLREGRKRQIRVMCEAVGLTVRRLIRTRVGPVRLGRLTPGSAREITGEEQRALAAEGFPERMMPLLSRPGDRILRPGPEEWTTVSKPATIAIDGPVAAGKSVIGKRLADRLGYLFLDTGAMYRAVTWLALQRGVPLDRDDELTRIAETIDLDIAPARDRWDGRAYTVRVEGEDVTETLRSPEVERAVSIVSRVPGVRDEMVRRQREYGGRGRVVMVGRDVGTVVLPDATLKIFLVAGVDERARRRYRELREKGLPVELETIRDDLVRRDRIDSERAIAPLRPAEDACVVDTDRLAIEQVVQRIEEVIAERGRAG